MSLTAMKPLKSQGIATAASDGGNPNKKIFEDQEHENRRKNSLTKKQILVEATPGPPLPPLPPPVESNSDFNLPPPPPVLPDVPLAEGDAKKDGLKMLAGTDSIFIDHSGPEFEELFQLNIKHKYVLLNAQGERIFFAGETLEEYCEAFSRHREVDMTVLGPLGGLVLDIQGTTRRVTVRGPDFSVIGYIRKRFLLKSYRILGPEKQELFRLLPVHAKVDMTPEEDSWEEEQERVGAAFKLIGPGSKVAIGELKSHHEAFQKEPKVKSLYGITFPSNADTNSKILISSAMIVLNFLFYEKFNVGNRRSQAYAGIIFGTIVGSIISLLLTIAVLWVVLKPGNGSGPVEDDRFKHNCSSDYIHGAFRS